MMHLTSVTWVRLASKQFSVAGQSMLRWHACCRKKYTSKPKCRLGSSFTLAHRIKKAESGSISALLKFLQYMILQGCPLQVCFSQGSRTGHGWLPILFAGLVV